ncbi:MAG: hypothetical protein HQK49_15355 [Oligoflexia bacterium]|nr:hypothetical protein [Oligoflexia bacterium]
MKCKYSIWTLIICIFTTGCLSSKYIPRKEYLLNIADPVSMSNLSKNIYLKKYFLFLDRITIVSPYNQLDFIYRINSSEYLTDYYNGFMSSPEEQVYLSLVKYLKQISNLEILTTLPEMIKANDTTTIFKLHTEITELMADYRDRNNPKTIVSIHVIIKKIEIKNSTTIILFDKTISSVIPIKKKNTESLVSGLNKCFQNVLEELIYIMKTYLIL